MFPGVPAQGQTRQPCIGGTPAGAHEQGSCLAERLLANIDGLLNHIWALNLLWQGVGAIRSMLLAH